MSLGRDGVWSARPGKVAILWDLDNKPPRGPPFDAATALRRVASLLGRVDTFAAYANRHAFTHLPSWVIEERRERRRQDAVERRGAVPEDPYKCQVCGRRLATRQDLVRHFKQLHERERQKKLARLRSIKGKNRRRRFHARFIAGNEAYNSAARELITPKSGYGLASELRRAGVRVQEVADKPQAADAAVKRQLQHSASSGMDWVVLVSDDSDYTEMVQRVKAASLQTVVVGDTRRALGRIADVWLPWDRVETGDVTEDMLRPGPRPPQELDEDRFGWHDDEYQDDFEVMVDFKGNSDAAFTVTHRFSSAFMDDDDEDDEFEEFNAEFMWEIEEGDDRYI